MSTIPSDEPLATAVVAAIHGGDVEGLRRLLDEHPGLGSARLRDPECGDERSLLHVVTDWPAHFPNSVAMIGVLVGAGADPNARFGGAHTETPLHWAASSDDVEALDALLEAGADIESPGAVIAGATPLADAVAFGQWNAARRLVERGAIAPLREAAALGLAERLEQLLTADPPPSTDDVTQALWYASHGGQPAVVERLVELGGDINWISTWDQLTPLDAASREGHDHTAAWLRANGAKPASDLT
jgi:ankyrin repeat protein